MHCQHTSHLYHVGISGGRMWMGWLAIPLKLASPVSCACIADVQLEYSNAGVIDPVL